MKRNLSETLSRSTPGSLPVPLFNQKRLSRLPLTSNPLENEFGPANDYPSGHSFPVTSLSSGNTGYSKVHTLGISVSAPQNSGWNRQEYVRRPLENSAGRNLAPISHSQGPGNTGSQIVKPSSCGPSSTTPHSFFRKGGVQPSQACLQYDQSFHRKQNLQLHSLPQRPKPNPPASCNQLQNLRWCLKSPSQSNLFKEDHLKEISNKTTSLSKKSQLGMKPVVENSLRILTATIEGMKHWSQNKDRAPMLFEVFGILDSAVTIGNHGAKNFFLRDGQDVVQCVFYETDVELPRLIRGQVHRCLGNCDPRTGWLTCMSIRHATPLEQKNAQEAVRASDAEMHRLVRLFSEV
ncbi:spermatogenesis-associated protein 22 [Arapaima gigas]